MTYQPHQAEDVTLKTAPAEPPGVAAMTELAQLLAEPRCPRCGLSQTACAFQRNFPDPEPF